MTDPALKAAVERPDWTITEHGVATFDEIEQAIVTLGGDDAVLAYRLQGFVAQSLAALSSQASVMEAMKRALELIGSGEFPDFCNGTSNDLIARANWQTARTALSQYRTLGGRHDD